MLDYAQRRLSCYKKQERVHWGASLVYIYAAAAAVCPNEIRIYKWRRSQRFDSDGGFIKIYFISYIYGKVDAEINEIV